MRWSLFCLLGASIVRAQTTDSEAAAAASSARPQSSGVSNAASSATTTPTETKTLGSGESVVTEPTYVSSLSTFVTTTYTTTTTPIAAVRPTDLPSSLYCTLDSANTTGPFCLPANNTDQIRGKQYSVTWDPSFAANCSNVYVALTYYNNPNAELVTSVKLPNILGFWNYTVEKDWLSGRDSQYAQLEILAYDCHYGTILPQSGPVVHLLSKAPVTAVQPTSKDRLLGLTIGLPLALFAFVGTVLLVYWWNKSHRQIPNFAKRGGRGYTGRKQRAVKLRDMDPSSSKTLYRDVPEPDYDT